MDGQTIQQQPAAEGARQPDDQQPDAAQHGQAPTPAADQAPQQPEGQAGAPEGSGLNPDEATGLKDRHGQDAISRGKYEREKAEWKREVADLKSQLDELSKTEQGRRELQEKLEALEAKNRQSDIDHSLEMAGCIDLKAANVRLADFDGDVSRLKESCPYLFAQEKQQTGRTGMPPRGASSGDFERRIDRAFGLPT